MSEKFITNRLTLIILVSACTVILISMGLRQTFGLFFQAFEEGLGVTRTEFGLAIGIQMIFWGFCNSEDSRVICRLWQEKSF